MTGNSRTYKTPARVQKTFSEGRALVQFRPEVGTRSCVQQIVIRTYMAPCASCYAWYDKKVEFMGGGMGGGRRTSPLRSAPPTRRRRATRRSYVPTIKRAVERARGPLKPLTGYVARSGEGGDFGLQGNFSSKSRRVVAAGT